MKRICITLMSVLLLASVAHGQQPKETPPPAGVTKQQITDLLAGALEQKEARKVLTDLAVKITETAHPSGGNADLLRHQFAQAAPGIAQLTMAVEYFGAFSGKQYRATIHLAVDFRNAQDIVVTRLDFLDGTNRIPANKQNLSTLRRKLTQMLNE
jgi:hypothetical protein